MVSRAPARLEQEILHLLSKMLVISYRQANRVCGMLCSVGSLSCKFQLKSPSRRTNRTATQKYDLIINMFRKYFAREIVIHSKLRNMACEKTSSLTFTASSKMSLEIYGFTN